ncbi:MAG TPA: trypsin-like serine protease [Polyangiaceae bacterium]|nr:trypsin-like serine protease [Polyangiaceae bacterium]
MVKLSALCLAGLAFAGCGAEGGDGMPTGKPSVAQGTLSAEATVCGVIELTDDRGKTVTRPEFYVFNAIRAKLERFALLRERFGASDVDSCEGARSFMKVYRQLGQEQPDYFAEPAAAEVAAFPEPASASGPEAAQGVASSQDAIQLGSASTHPAVLRIDWSDGSSCTGTSISTYGILTSAHCFAVNGWHQVHVSRMNTANSTAPLLGGPVWVYFNRHEGYTGPGDWADDLAVGTLWFEYPAASLPAPSSNAIRLASSVTISTGTQVDIRGYGGTDVWGTGWGLQRKGESRVSRVAAGYIGSVPVPGDATPNTTCKGDSGGPISRKHDTRDIQYGITSGFTEGADWQACAVANAEARSTRVQPKLSWIETQLGFACGRFTTTSPAGTIARCW